MRISEKAGRFARFVFYLGLGGWTALLSACYESTDGSKRDAGTPAPDSGGSETPETGTRRRDAAVDAGILGDATAVDAASDGSRVDRPVRSDASAQVSDSGSGDAMWDVIYE
jgi:hypothetical protein